MSQSVSSQCQRNDVAGDGLAHLSLSLPIASKDMPLGAFVADGDGKTGMVPETVVL